jgi:hypothetical protein
MKMNEYQGFLALPEFSKLKNQSIENICFSNSGIIINFSHGAFINYANSIEIRAKPSLPFTSQFLICELINPLFLGAFINTVEVQSPRELFLELSTGAALRFTIVGSGELETFAITGPEGFIAVV